VTITHHLDPATILAYTAGTLSEALSIVAASHIAWCGECRKAVRAAETVGGEMIASMEEVDVSDACREATLARLEQATVHRFPRTKLVHKEAPAPLDRLLGGKTLTELAWKTKAPGVQMVELPLAHKDRGKLLLMRIAPGKSMPEHGHGGEEITMILSGAYNDKFGRFTAGDVADLDEHVDHKPIVEDGEACICLVATEAPTRFKSLPARLLQPLIGI
jgi:putative transcriptional regulator